MSLNILLVVKVPAKVTALQTTRARMLSHLLAGRGGGGGFEHGRDQGCEHGCFLGGPQWNLKTVVLSQREMSDHGRYQRV